MGRNTRHGGAVNVAARSKRSRVGSAAQCLLMALSWRNLPCALKAAIERVSGPWATLASLARHTRGLEISPHWPIT